MVEKSLILLRLRDDCSLLRSGNWTNPTALERELSFASNEKDLNGFPRLSPELELREVFFWKFYL